MTFFNSRKIDIDNKVIPQLLQESDIKNVAEIVGASQAPQQTKLPKFLLMGKKRKY